MPPETTTTTTVSVEQEVEEAYLAYWAMLDRLAQDPDPDDPEIPQRATGDALEELVEGLIAMKAAGWRSEFGDEHRHTVLSVEVSNGDAAVKHCAIDSSRVIEAASGEPVGSDVGGDVTLLYEATLLLTNAGWTVREVAEADSWPGAGDCS